MYQSKSAAAGLGDGDEQISAGRAPKRARGGEFGQCEVFRRVKPIHQSKHAAGSLGNAKIFTAPNLCTKVSPQRRVWAMRSLSPRQTYAPKRARGGEFGQCEDLRRAKPMYQSKSAAAGLGDDDEQISAGRAPKQARGGEFGQCQDSHRVKPMHQSEHAAGSLGNAKTLAAPNLCTKASTRRQVWVMAMNRSAPGVHQSKHAAGSLGNAKSFAAPNLNQKVLQLTFRMRQEFHAAP